MTIASPAFLDTNILVYAYDLDEGEKHLAAKKIVQSVFEGEISLAVSNQVLAEFLHVVRFRWATPMPKREAEEIVKRIAQIPQWVKLNYSIETLLRAFSLANEKVYFWDFIIAQTMLENGITTLYTENTRDFEGINGVKVVNPFK